MLSYIGERPRRCRGTAPPLCFLLAVVAAALCAGPLLAAPVAVAGDYAYGPVRLDAHGRLYFSIDRAAGVARLALHVSDAAYFASSSTSSTTGPGGAEAGVSGPAWLGLGVGEPTSGHMPGSDIATAHFAPGASAACRLVDRHVPFVAYPLWLPPAVFPAPDACQADGGWTLVRCARNASDLLFEVERGLAAHDDQDRALGPGFQNLLYAYGTSFGYHGRRRRHSARLALYNAPGVSAGAPVAAVQVPLPNDADGQVLLTASGYRIPADKTTTYSCTSKRVKLPGAGPRAQLMVVAADPVLEAVVTSEEGEDTLTESPVHHLLVFLCSEKKYADQFLQTRECTTSSDRDLAGPVGNIDSGCSTLLFGYTKGSRRQVLPKEAGFLVTSENAYLVMETHYENSALNPNISDSSGVRLHTASRRREHEAGSLMLGDVYVQLGGFPVESGRKYQMTCPSSCLRQLSRPVNLFSSLLHMHRTGRQMYTNRFTRDVRYIETVSKVNFWNDNFQPVTYFDPPKTVAPGDVLQTTCQYDTSKRNGTVFGLGLENEMCINFVGYWPVQRFNATGATFNVCSPVIFPRRGGVFTDCGDASASDLRTSIIFEGNPAFNDVVGAPTSFGQAGGTCNADTSPEPGAADATDDPLL